MLILFKILAARVSNSLNPDLARRFVVPDLGPNCLQRLSADDTSRQRVNACVTTAADDTVCDICLVFCRNNAYHS